MNAPPFSEGERVMERGCEHFGPMTVVECKWIDHTAPGVPHYWLVVAQPDQPEAGGHNPEGVGYVVHGCASASADRFYRKPAPSPGRGGEGSHGTV